MAVAIPYIIAAVAAAGSYSQSKQAQSAAHYQAQAQKVNAQNILSMASANEDALRRKSAQALGSQRAALAESGIALDYGTGADLTSSSALNAEMDALNLRYQGTINAQNSNSQADLDEYQAKAYGKAAGLNAATSALSSYSGAGGSFKGSTGVYN